MLTSSPTLAAPRWSLTGRQWSALILPFALIGSMLAVFIGFNRWLGQPLGYLAAFLVYWLGWCLLAPALLLGGPRQVFGLFNAGSIPLARLGWKAQLVLWGPILFPLFFVFIPKLPQASFSILLVSALLGLVIGVTEEILWRGLFLRLFPANVWLNSVYPSVLFALWHLAPQAVVANRQAGGSVTFVVYALLLGLGYAYIARKTNSIRGTAVAHIIHDALGLGAFAYVVWLAR